MAYKPWFVHLFFSIAALNRYRTIADSNPTLRPAEPFDPEEDAIRLKEAMTSPSALKQAIIDILTKRVESQRLEIVEAYQGHCGQSLTNEILKKVNETYYANVVEALLFSSYAYFATDLYSIKKMPFLVDTEDVIEMLCTQSDSDLHKTIDAYEEMFSTPFKESNERFIGDIIFRMCIDNRNEAMSVDEDLVFDEATEFIKMGDVGTRELWDYIILIESNNYHQLRQIFHAYKNITGRDFEVDMKEDLSDDSLREFMVRRVVRSIKSRNDFFAERLHASLHDKPETFTRIVVSRSEIDLGDIKEAFARRYNETLEDYIIKSDCNDHIYPLLSLISPSFNFTGLLE